MERYDELIEWLDSIFKNQDFSIEAASSDASFRRYFRVKLNQETVIVMDAPPEKESCDTFIDVTQRLLDAKINAPEILFQNLERGFLCLSDLGSSDYLSVIEEDNADNLYQDAIDSLVLMQEKADKTGLPQYGHELFLQEIELFRVYLMQTHLKLEMSEKKKQSWHALNEFLIRNATSQAQSFVHRDYHSRNLIFDPSKNPGVIDYQDAVIGPLTYDLVSLLKDCYVKWPMERIYQWLKYYYENSTLAKSTGLESFCRQFHLMGVQRHLKASGIFCRLYYRDGKSGYFKDIPRTLSYIIDLKGEFGELNELCNWIEQDIQYRLEEASIL